MVGSMDFIIENSILKKYLGEGGDVVVPDGVTEITQEAFFGREDMTSITMPTSIARTGEYAFWGCINLKNVYIKDLANWCAVSFGFKGNPLCNGANLYVDGEKITRLRIPNGIKRLENSSFFGCVSLTSIEIPSSVAYIGQFAFACCANLMNVNIPSGATDVGVSAFVACEKLATVNIPCCNKIGPGAFLGCLNLSNINLSDGNVKIGEQAFSECTRLLRIKLPRSMIRKNLMMIFERKDNILIEVPETGMQRLLSLDECDMKKQVCVGSLLASCEYGDGTLLKFKNALVKNRKRFFKYLISCDGATMDDYLRFFELIPPTAKHCDEYLQQAMKNRKTDITAFLLNYSNNMKPRKGIFAKFKL